MIAVEVERVSGRGRRGPSSGQRVASVRLERVMIKRKRGEMIIV